MRFFDSELLVKYNEKLINNPNYCYMQTLQNKLLTVTQAKGSFVMDNYMVACPQWHYWNFYGETGGFTEPHAFLPLWVIADKKMLVCYEQNQCGYFSPKHPCDTDDYFLFFLYQRKITKFIYCDSNLPHPLHLTLNSEINDLRGLAVTLLAHHNQLFAEKLKDVLYDKEDTQDE